MESRAMRARGGRSLRILTLNSMDELTIVSSRNQTETPHKLKSARHQEVEDEMPADGYDNQELDQTKWVFSSKMVTSAKSPRPQQVETRRARFGLPHQAAAATSKRDGSQWNIVAPFSSEGRLAVDNFEAARSRSGGEITAAQQQLSMDFEKLELDNQDSSDEESKDGDHSNQQSNLEMIEEDDDEDEEIDDVSSRRLSQVPLVPFVKYELASIPKTKQQLRAPRPTLVCLQQQPNETNESQEDDDAMNIQSPLARDAKRKCEKLPESPPASPQPQEFDHIRVPVLVTKWSKDQLYEYNTLLSYLENNESCKSGGLPSARVHQIHAFLRSIQPKV